MKQGIQVAIFNEIDLSLIGIFPSINQAAEVACGDSRKNGNLKKYLDGQINQLYGKVYVYFNGEDMKTLTSIARVRKSRALLTRLDAKTVEKISDQDIKQLALIINRYGVNILSVLPK